MDVEAPLNLMPGSSAAAAADGHGSAADPSGHYRALVEQTNELAAVVGPDGRALYLSPSHERVLGYPVEELLGRDLLTLLHPDDVAQVRQILGDMASQGLPAAQLEVRFLHASGEWRFLEASATNLLQVPAVGGIVTNARDVTDRRAADARMRALTERLRVVTELASAVVGASDLDELQSTLVQACGQVMSFDALTLATYDPVAHTLDFLGAYDDGVYSTPAVVPVAGTPSEHVIRERRSLVVGSTDDPKGAGAVLTGTRRRSQSVIRTPVLGGNDVLAVLAVHSYTPALYSSDDAEVLEAVACLAATAIEKIRHLNARDAAAAAQREATAELARSEARFRSLIEHGSDLIYVLNIDGTISYVSPSVQRVLGWSPAERIGHNVFEHIHPDDLQRTMELFRRSVASGRLSEGITLRARHRDGSLRTLEAFGENYLSNPDIRGIVVSARDVTERIELEQQLRQAQKMEAIGRLAGGVAHDFNNVLTAITGYGHFVLDSLSAADPLRPDVEEIVNASNRAAGVVRQLLAFSRKQVVHLEVLSLTTVVREVEKMLRRLLGEDVSLAVCIEAQTPFVRGDRTQLEQVLVNLAVNARDAMPTGGALTITIRHVEQSFDDAAPQSYVMLSLQDSGHGVDEAVLPHIFEPFFTTKEPGRGTGLGLATVYGIVKQNGGHIAVHSERGVGTRFDVYFPAAAVTEPKPPAIPVHKETATASGIVLVVEDEPPVRTLVRRVLERRGYRVLEARDGHDALNVLAMNGRPIDLLLTDAVMPGMGGKELAARVAELQPGVRILFMSGYAEDEVVHRGVVDPGLAFSEKPFQPDALVRKVRALIDDEES